MRKPEWYPMWLILLCLFIPTEHLPAQDLLTSRTNSPLTYIYKITDSEAKTIYRKGFGTEGSQFLHTLVDSFPTDSVYQGQLSAGHYIKIFAGGNQQKYFITSVQDFEVMLLDNKQDLAIRIYDVKGDIVSDARVKVRGTRLRFDDDIQAYMHRKSNRKGILTVDYMGQRAFFDLERQHNNPAILRHARILLTETPLRYAWIPVEFIVRLPFDAYRSLNRRWAIGTIAQTGRFFSRVGARVACVVDDWYCDDYYERFEQRHKGYMVFNKSKYQPGDTVKFKAFIVNKKGNPVVDSVDVILTNDRKRIKLGSIDPYHPGGFSFKFFLEDSLKLQLNKAYTISLEQKPYKTFITGRFRYEDYELSGIRLSLRTTGEKHYQGQPFFIYAKGSDENDLQIMDGRLEMVLMRQEVHRVFPKQAFIPDTLWTLNLPLEYNRETEISIPDSIMPLANFSYEVSMRLLTSSNEIISQSKSIDYYHQNNQFEILPHSDSLLFQYVENGTEKDKMARVYAHDNFNNARLVYEGTCPVTIPIMPYYSSYEIIGDSIGDEINVSDVPAQIDFSTSRTSDSLWIVAHNPLGIPFSYHIYKGNRMIEKGFAKELDLILKANKRKNYFIAISYLWGGRMINQRRRIDLNEKNLTLQVEQPNLIYPGQKTSIDVLVTDIDGNPVQGVDITAHGLTSKFNYTSPVLPNLGSIGRNQRFINSFHLSDFGLSNGVSEKLNYDFWRSLDGIDSIAFYQFLYPDPIYRFTYATRDDITQFAPFILSKGNFEPIHVVYVDHRPVWFSFSGNTQPWAFRVAHGYRHVRIRTQEREYVMDSLFFQKGEKLIVSMNKDINTNDVMVYKRDPKFDPDERSVLKNYLFPVRHTGSDQFAWIENDNTIFRLNSPVGRHGLYYNLLGPVAGPVKFVAPGHYSLNFFHEPGFQYEFAPELLKMRTFDHDQVIPKKLPYGIASGSFQEEVITRNMLLTLKRKYDIDRLKMRLYMKNPRLSGTGLGTIELRYIAKKKNSAPDDILVVRLNDPTDFRLYGKDTRTIVALTPGYYRIGFLYEDNRYHTIDVETKANGINFFNIEQPDSLVSHQPYTQFQTLIREIMSLPYDLPKMKETDPIPSGRVVSSPSGFGLEFEGSGYVARGYVYDATDGNTLPGVTIIVKGTSTGVVSNMDGYFEINVPVPESSLIFSFVGYMIEEVSARSANNNSIFLTPDVMALEEVVVTGYGVRSRNMLTSSVIEVDDEIFSSALQGQVAGVMIRGAASNSKNMQPLYVIDGMPYMGDPSLLDMNSFTKIEILEAARAMAIYGSKAAGGVVLVSTVSNTNVNSSNDHGANEFAMPQYAGSSNTMRTNFSDYAFWQPELITDGDGKARFEVVFPDDITSWDTHYLAMNESRQTGQTSSNIRSYLPLSAQLALPRFLIQSDTSFALARIFNYMHDTVQVNTRLLIDDFQISERELLLVHSALDTITLNPESADSLKITYSISREDGYFDGEERFVPVYQPGIQQTEGVFYVFNRDSLLHLDFEETKGKVTLYARSSTLEVLEEEIENVVSFKYYCNEQIASRIKALLALKRITEIKEENFNRNNEIVRLINRLEQNQSQPGMWGWWKNSKPSPWITLHAMEALELAIQEGFQTGLVFENVASRWVWEYENGQSINDKLFIVKILRKINASVNYEGYIKQIQENANLFTLNQLLHFIRVSQLCGIETFDIDTLNHYKEESLTGDVWYWDNSYEYSLLRNDIQNSLLVYEILKNDSLPHTQTLDGIRNYFMTERRAGFWRNTYESSRIIETILPDLLEELNEDESTELIISGDLEQTITEFPFELDAGEIEKISISRKGSMPLYFTAYQTWQNREPEVKANDLAITTSFEGKDTIDVLQAGSEIVLNASVTVKKEAEYVMIKIPIPAGCSYIDEQFPARQEVHREYFRNEVVIFCEKLPRGEFSFDVKLIPRYAGRYQMNPAQIELMYFPVFNANESMKKITIE